jgi:adenylosuccinate lyase
MEHQLTALSPIDGRYHDKTKPLQAYFSEYALIKYRVIVELKWLLALSKEKNITELAAFTPDQESKIDALIQNFSLADALEVKNLEAVTNHDVKAVEYFLKKQLESILGANSPKLEFIHFACTSEDINNLAYALMLKEGTQAVLLPQLDQILMFLKNKAKQFASLAMLSRTHGQTASPTTLGKEFANFYMRLKEQVESLKQFAYSGKINGAVGNYNAHLLSYPEVDWIQFSQNFIGSLGLKTNLYTTQIEPNDGLAVFCHTLSRINIILLDLCQDFWGYIALDYFKLRTVATETGSSTMPHKVNPIDFENAEGNLGMANAILHHLATKMPVSRFQRDLSGSTVIRNIGVGLANSFLAYLSVSKGFSKLDVNQERIAQDLNQHVEVLTEGLQTVMRRYGIAEPYEKLKWLSRGKKLDLAGLKEFILTLALPEEIKQNMLKLLPENYIGLAAKLAQEVE